MLTHDVTLENHYITPSLCLNNCRTARRGNMETVGSDLTAGRSSEQLNVVVPGEMLRYVPRPHRWTSHARKQDVLGDDKNSCAHGRGCEFGCGGLNDDCSKRSNFPKSSSVVVKSGGCIGEPIR